MQPLRVRSLPPPSATPLVSLSLHPHRFILSGHPCVSATLGLRSLLKYAHGFCMRVSNGMQFCFCFCFVSVSFLCLAICLFLIISAVLLTRSHCGSAKVSRPSDTVLRCGECKYHICEECHPADAPPEIQLLDEEEPAAVAR